MVGGADDGGIRRVSVDERIANVARSQHGVITRGQLLREVELRPGAVDRRLASGRLIGVYRGVYRVAGRQLPLGWAMAAALVGGDAAVVSGRSAAAVHGIGAAGPRVEITSPRQHQHPGLRCHRARLRPEDLTTHLGVPVTSVARTVLDIAGRGDYSDARLAQLVNRARIVHPAVIADLDVLVGRLRERGLSRRPEARLQPHLDDRNGPVRSVFEREFRLALAASDLPSAQFNVSVGGMEVDVLWSDVGLVVELDGHAFHSDRRAFERDRERDARLCALGHQVIRLTWRRWRDQPDVELRRLRTIITARA